MLKIEEAILINKYGQGIVSSEFFLEVFSDLTIGKKRDFLRGIVELIFQSKPQQGDILPAIEESKLRATYTPCVLLMKGISSHKLQKIIELPETEMNKSLLLLLALFKLAYQRRFEKERNDADKWWYWDLSEIAKEEEIKRMFKH